MFKNHVTPFSAIFRPSLSLVTPSDTLEFDPSPPCDASPYGGHGDQKNRCIHHVDMPDKMTSLSQKWIYPFGRALMNDKRTPFTQTLGPNKTVQTYKIPKFLSLFIHRGANPLMILQDPIVHAPVQQHGCFIIQRIGQLFN